MGAVIGSAAFKEIYVANKVSKWVEDVEEMAKIAQDEPQAAYSCFTKAISHRWTYVQRTIPDIEHLFEPLEFAIRDKLIPALVGRNVSDVERRIFALPVRLGGMGIPDPSITCNHEHTASMAITENLTRIIVNQEKDFSNYNKEEVKERINASKALKVSRRRSRIEGNPRDCRSKNEKDTRIESGDWCWGVAHSYSQAVSRIHPQQTGIQG